MFFSDSKKNFYVDSCGAENDSKFSQISVTNRSLTIDAYLVPNSAEFFAFGLSHIVLK